MPHFFPIKSRVGRSMVNIQGRSNNKYQGAHASIKQHTRASLQYVMVTNPRSGFTTMQKRKGTAANNLLASDLGKDFRA